MTESQRAIAGLEGSRKTCPKRAKIPAATDTIDNIDGWPSLIRNKLFACNTARRIRLIGSPAIIYFVISSFLTLREPESVLLCVFPLESYGSDQSDQTLTLNPKMGQ